MGTELRKLARYIAPSRAEMDFTNYLSVKNFVKKEKPDMIVHSGAYTDVAKPEAEEQEMVKCYLTNVIGTRNIASAAGIVPVIYISSDYVLEPVNFYSLTKLQGEKERAGRR